MQSYQKWLDKMKQAWEAKDYEILSSMFPEKLIYLESPFLSPLESKQEVIDQWKKDLEKQQDIKFDYKILYEDENCCFANWSASFTRDSASVILDGIFHFMLDSENKCTYFKQWWVTK